MRELIKPYMNQLASRTDEDEYEQPMELHNQPHPIDVNTSMEGLWG